MTEVFALRISLSNKKFFSSLNEEAKKIFRGKLQPGIQWGPFFFSVLFLVLLQTWSKDPLELKSVMNIYIQYFVSFFFMVAFVPIFILQVSWRAESPDLVGIMNKCSVHGFRDADSISFQLSTPLTEWVEHKSHGLKKSRRLF